MTLTAPFPLCPGLHSALLPLAEAALAAAPLLALAQRYGHRGARLHSFLAGRMAAMAALTAAGYPALAPLRGEQGAPLWPPGCLGSIAHGGDWAIALAGQAPGLRGVGVDIEPNEPLPLDASSVILRAEERDWLAHTPSPLAGCRAVFGLKESLHKALNPLNGAWLEFDEVAVLPSAGGYAVQARSAQAQIALAGLQIEAHAGLAGGLLCCRLLLWAAE